ncbi:MAG: DUF1330 domain-containing protein [Bacteroidota bacterium]
MKKSILIYTLIISAWTLFINKAQAQDNDAQRTILVINAVVDQEHKAELKEYLSQMMKIFKEHGGEPLGRYKTIEKISGSQVPEMIALISFENSNVVKTLLNSAEYKNLSELRKRVFSDLKIVLCSNLN